MLKPRAGTILFLILLFSLHKVRFLIATFLQPCVVNVRTYKQTKYTVRIGLHCGALVEQQTCPMLSQLRMASLAHRFSSAGCDGVPFNPDTWRQPELVKVKEGRK